MKKLFAYLYVCLFFLLFHISAQKVPAPNESLGFTPGDDKKLASWNQIVDYFKKLDAAKRPREV
ncbi:MAG: hypothetical protein WKF71_01035 [Pyrinomonadaceae bacterium]